MVELPQRAKYTYSTHGWSDADIEYLEINAEFFEEESGWCIAGAYAPDGVLWLFPASQNDIFPYKLWKIIRNYVVNNLAVVIPVSKNQDLVRPIAKRYNGYLQDNMLIFGDELKGLKYYIGENRWLAEGD